MFARKIPALLVALLVLFASACPEVSAEGNAGGWYEALEETSLSPNGDNYFIMSDSETIVKLDIEPHRRLAKVDLLISHTTGDAPTYIGVKYNDTYSGLTLVPVSDNITRAFGNITYGLYEDLYLKFVKSGTNKVYYELLSCKVSSLRVTDFSAQGKLYRSFTDPSPLTLPNNFSVSGNGGDNHMEYKLIPVVITDWAKYDYITLFGSISQMALNSFRASIGNKGLPYTITYTESVPTNVEGSSESSWVQNSTTNTTYNDNDYIRDDSTSYTDGMIYGGTENHSAVVYGGAVLYTITIDLTGIDRNASGDMNCYFTCIASPSLGYAFNVQNVSGSVVTADTSTVTWWVRFTTFMQNLFAPDTSESDQFQGEAGEKAEELENANQELDNVTRPAVEDVVTDFNDFATDADFAAVGNVFSYIANDELFSMILLMSLTVALLAYVLYGKR